MRPSNPTKTRLITAVVIGALVVAVAIPLLDQGPLPSYLHTGLGGDSPQLEGALVVDGDCIYVEYQNGEFSERRIAYFRTWTTRWTDESVEFLFGGSYRSGDEVLWGGSFSNDPPGWRTNRHPTHCPSAGFAMVSGDG